METELERLARERKERCSARGWSWRVFGLSLLCVAVGAVSGELTRSEIPGWYAGLAKPSFNPPNWLFGPVWGALYLLMGFSAGRAWDAARSRPEARSALRTFFVILLVNALWSLLFFGLHRPDLALIDIFAYVVLLVVWLRQLRAFDKMDYLLQLPHLAWVSFATVLNASIWWLNK
jgi:translocator protein